MTHPIVTHAPTEAHASGRLRPRSARHPTFVFAAGALILVLGGCGAGSSASGSGGSNAQSSSTTASTSPSLPTSDGVVIKDFGYSGGLTVKPGQRVTVTNEDSVAHTLTDKKTHVFDTGNLQAGGGTGTFTAPSKPGTYPFGCSYHPDMAGNLIVKG